MSFLIHRRSELGQTGVDNKGSHASFPHKQLKLNKI